MWIIEICHRVHRATKPARRHIRRNWNVGPYTARRVFYGLACTPVLIPLGLLGKLWAAPLPPTGNFIPGGPIDAVQMPEPCGLAIILVAAIAMACIQWRRVQRARS